MKLRIVLVIAFLCLLIVNCAKRGRPTGGPKDEDAPIMVSAKPNFETTNFDAKEIRIDFDEFIKLKDLNKQLVVSPPMKYQPIITPQGTASKFIKIKILDTLKENTTYTFNFGQSVIDNTEGNVLRNFKYIFSTGDYIDSLKVTGTVKDAFLDKTDKDISILLYEFNDSYNDSLIYNEKPLYVGNTLDTTTWEITNIKAGKYKLIALKDPSKDYKFSPKQDKIAFLEKEIIIPQDSIAEELVLFKEVLPYRINRPSEETKNRLWIGYEGEIDSTFQVNNLLETTSSIITKEKDKDTLNYWYKDVKIDSLYLQMVNKIYSDTLVVRKRSKKVDSLNLKINARGVLPLKEKLKLLSNIPLELIDTSKIELINKDTAAIKYNLQFGKNPLEAIVDFELKPEEKYRLKILPDAVTDFLGNKNDTLQYNFTTKAQKDYGTIMLTLQNVKSYPIIVQLVKSSSNTYEVIEEMYAKDAQKFEFNLLEPAKYKVRIIYDTNKNGKWDTGSFLENLQPEKVVYYPTEIDLKANWDKEETFILE